MRARALHRPWRARIALVVAVNLAVVGIDALVAFRRASDSAVAISADGVDATQRAQQVSTLLKVRERAVKERDRTAFLSTVDPNQQAFYNRQSRLFDNLAKVPIGTWHYVVDASQTSPEYPKKFATYKAPVWVPLVTLSYSLAGYDTHPALLIERFTFVQRSGAWLIGNDDDFTAGGSPSGRGIWDYGTVVRATGKSSLVLGHPRAAATLQQIANLADDAVAHVTSVWGTAWSRKVVVLVPDTQEELAAIISEGNDLSEIAAVAVAQNAGGNAPQGEFGDRIILNPVNFVQLSDVGRKVILRHEVTHVASRSVTGSIAPQWLVEGVADYVGYRDAGIALPVVAHELAADVKAGYRPQKLPDDSDFASYAPKLAQAYEMSWIACRLIVEKVGERGLVRFYRMVGLSKAPTANEAVDKAMSSVLHESYASFVELWRQRIVGELS